MAQAGLPRNQRILGFILLKRKDSPIQVRACWLQRALCICWKFRCCSEKQILCWACLHMNSHFAKHAELEEQTMPCSLNPKLGIHMCMCACMHVCMHVCMYGWMYGCMHVCICTYLEDQFGHKFVSPRLFANRAFIFCSDGFCLAKAFRAGNGKRTEIRSATRAQFCATRAQFSATRAQFGKVPCFCGTHFGTHAFSEIARFSSICSGQNSGTQICVSIGPLGRYIEGFYRDHVPLFPTKNQ